MRLQMSISRSYGSFSKILIYRTLSTNCFAPTVGYAFWLFLNPLYALGFRSEGLNGDKISDFAIES